MEVTMCYFAFLFVIFLAVFRLVKETYDRNNKQTPWQGITSRPTIKLSNSGRQVLRGAYWQHLTLETDVPYTTCRCISHHHLKMFL